MHTYRVNVDNADILVIQAEVIDFELKELIQVAVKDCIENHKSLILEFITTEIKTLGLEYDLQELHQQFYEELQLSFVVVSANPIFSPTLKDSINICPTRMEAIEIVNMEVIEREFLMDDDSGED